MGNLNNEGSSERMRKEAALERLGDPREFSNAVMGVVTCSYLSGCLIRLDGGVRAPHLWFINISNEIKRKLYIILEEKFFNNLLLIKVIRNNFFRELHLMNQIIGILR